jgi:hypothetical protein
MAGLVMDAVLMLLLVAALGYGVRLEKRLRALREGQLAFAGAVTELNQAASRAEAALSALRGSGQETDLLHDRIVKAREVKQQLETLIARAPAAPVAARAPVEVAPPAEPALRPREPRGEPVLSGSRDRERSLFADRAPDRQRLLNEEQVERFTPVLQALAANQAAKQSLNRARRSLDEDLFAA